jgi:hypothetical protein
VSDEEGCTLIDDNDLADIRRRSILGPLEEREACAKIAEEYSQTVFQDYGMQDVAARTAEAIAKAIRARG